jgi:hypothetical protein
MRKATVVWTLLPILGIIIILSLTRYVLEIFTHECLGKMYYSWLTMTFRMIMTGLTPKSYERYGND